MKPRGAIFVLLEALKKEKLDLDSFLEVLDELIRQGFRPKEEVCLETIKEARKSFGENKFLEAKLGRGWKKRA
ncbi:MAG: hypothetical protein QMD95_04095 [Candidatus Hodarchaeaceae archaeon]|nr:hypothetical protein [Candidatus Hodarchaeaceae archaeon]